MVEPSDTTIDVTSDRGRVRPHGRRLIVSGTLYEFRIPFSGDGDLLKIHGSRVPGSTPHADVESNEIVVRFVYEEGKLPTPDELEHEVRVIHSSIAERLDQIRPEIEDLNRRLEETIHASLERRRGKVLGDRDLAAALPFELARRMDPSPVLQIDIPPTQPAELRTVAGPAGVPERVLTRSSYDALVESIHAFGAAAERFPRTFSPMSEEILREILLVTLNNQFGVAAGEMFSRVGKTDISVVRENGPIFIAECKIWGGQQVFLDAIDQLLGYLVWRDTKAALVVFIRNRKVAAAMEKAVETLRGHGQFVEDGPSTGSCLTFILHHLNDPSRHVDVALVPVVLEPATDG
jgi:hypothetical protein